MGGYETTIFHFKLSGSPTELTKPLVLRLFPQSRSINDAIFESTIQNILVDQGYPVPRVHFTCTDRSILDGAFLIMDFIDGKDMFTASFETFPSLLGKAHASLHNINLDALIKALQKQGVDEYWYSLSKKLDWVNKEAERNYPWLREGINWLVENRPLEPERLSICHNDFHPSNILVKDGIITGVLDWGQFIVGDPAMDVAFTSWVTSIPLKVIADFNTEHITEMYLDSYRAIRTLDETNIAYYKSLRSVQSLIEGAQGHSFLALPEVVELVVASIYEVTGVKIIAPS
jgi:aminoglycoside phosphotransferase (APT) family kinase protein